MLQRVGLQGDRSPAALNRALDDIIAAFLGGDTARFPVAFRNERFRVLRLPSV